MAKRASKFDVQQELGIPPFFVDGIMDQARRFDRAAFERMHAALYQADKLLKSSRLDDARLLEQLVLSLVPEKLERIAGSASRPGYATR
jgi:DNA polymerase III delta subunit